VIEVLRGDGIEIVSRKAPRTPTTVVLPVGDDRAMVTVDPGVRSSAADVAALAPRAVAVNLDLLYVVPDGAAGYVTCGDDDARAFAGRPPARLSAARALFVSEGEALVLSGADELDAAIGMLGAVVPTVVVTLGARGAVASVEGERVDAGTAPLGAVPVVDATGAGDLLVAAYIWADQLGVSPSDRLRWAVIYATLSVATPTAVAGAVSLQRLLEEGARAGLSAPNGAATNVG
jgi:sugar/nucleoside kinase (ribokinase family)